MTCGRGAHPLSDGICPCGLVAHVSTGPSAPPAFLAEAFRIARKEAA